MTETVLRPVTADEFDRFYWTSQVAYGEEFRDEDVASMRTVLPLQRTLAAVDGDGQMVGTTCSYPLDVSVPGGSTPMAGITAVAVLPTHRRRGVTRALLQRQLADLRDHGEPLACLWASEARIYGRFGFGPASFADELTIERPHSAFRHDTLPSSVRFLDVGGALACFPDIYARARVERGGMPARDEAWWHRWLGLDLEHHRHGMTPRFHAAVGDRGYVVYRLKEGSWDAWVPDVHLEVEELVAGDPDTETALWRFCLDMDLVRTVHAPERPVDDVLPYLLDDPRRLRRLTHDALWIRIVRLEEALATRRYGREAALVLAVRDQVCPWNEGTWSVEVGPKGARASRTSGAPHLSLDIADLGAIFLGGERLSRLHRAGRVVEHVTGAVAAVDAAFAADPAPWCPFIF